MRGAYSARAVRAETGGRPPYVYISEDGGVNQLQVRFAAAGAAMWMVNIYPCMLVQQVVSGAMRGAPQRFM